MALLTGLKQTAQWLPLPGARADNSSLYHVALAFSSCTCTDLDTAPLMNALWTGPIYEWVHCGQMT